MTIIASLQALPLEMLVLFAYIVAYGLLLGCRNMILRLGCLFRIIHNYQQNNIGYILDVLWVTSIIVFMVLVL